MSFHPDTILAATLENRKREAENLFHAQCAHDELMAQYRSEAALYGDAWPGAWLDVQRSREDLRRLANLVDRLDAIVRKAPLFGPAGLLAPQDRPLFSDPDYPTTPFGPAEPSTEEPF